MKTPNLSEETIKRLPAPARGNSITYFAGATIQGAKAPRGFGVRVTSAGARAFVLNYRLRGREHRFTIGAWPDWSALKAVREARNLRQRVDRGENPLKDREPVPATKSVSSVIDAFMTRYVRNKDQPLRSADQIESAFERLVKPHLGKIGVHELRRSHVAEMLDKRSFAMKLSPALLRPNGSCVNGNPENFTNEQPPPIGPKRTHWRSRPASSAPSPTSTTQRRNGAKQPSLPAISEVVPMENDLPSFADVGLCRKEIHEARIIRDEEVAEPGVVRRTLDDAIRTGKEPTKAQAPMQPERAAPEALRSP